MKDMNRNRHNVQRDETTRMIHSQRHSDTYSWLRTLREIRGLREVAALAFWGVRGLLDLGAARRPIGAP